MICFAQNIFGQQQLIDSLKTKINLSTNDSITLDLTASLSLAYINYKPDSALLLAKDTEKKSFHYPIIYAKTLSYLGIYYNNSGDSEKSLQYQLKSLRINDSLHYEKGQADNYLGIGFVHQKLKNNNEALDKYLKAKTLYEKLDDKTNLARVYNNLGIIYKRLGQKDQALKSYEKSLEMKIAIGDFRSTASTYNNIGDIFITNGDTLAGMKYFEKSLAIANEYNHPQMIMLSLNTLAEMWVELKNPEKSILYAEKSLDVAQKYDFRTEKANAFYQLSAAYVLQNNFETALNYYQKYTELKDSLYNVEKAKAVSDLQAVYDLDKKKKELELLKKDQEIRNIEAEKNKNLIILLEKNNEIQNIEASRRKLDILLLERDKKLKEEALERQKSISALEHEEVLKKRAELESTQVKLEAEQLKEKLWMFLVLASFISLGILIWSLWIRNKKNAELKKQKEILAEQNEEISQQKEELHALSQHLSGVNTELEQNVQFIQEQKTELWKKNKELTDSITYARKIQQAILPSEKDIKNFVHDLFIFYKPKDIVSGDFYWFAEKGEWRIMALADCTGHGVPGAFMSLVGNDMLNLAVHDKELRYPDEILKQVHAGLIQAFKRDAIATQVSDGMDISLCSWNQKTGDFYFSGAFHPLIGVQNNQIIELKGDKGSIGAFVGERNFIRHHLSLNYDLKIYLFSDGYQDQMGGNLNRKFMRPQFRELLTRNHQLPMVVQKELLEQNLNLWIGNNKQTDDITVLGFEIKKVDL